MAVLSRLRPALSGARPQVLHLNHKSLTRTSFSSPRSCVPGAKRHLSVGGVLDTAAYEAAQLISTLHTVTGTPWYITIPLTALAVNIVIRLPTSIYSRKLEQKRTRLNPLFWAWNARHTENVVRANPGKLTAQLTAAIQRKSRASERRISKDHGVPLWKVHYLGSMVAFPFFITAIQGVRSLCGAGGGLFSLFSNPLRAKGTEEEAAVPVVSAPEPHATQTLSTPDASIVQSQAVPPPTPSPEALTSDLLGYEPSLSTGGCLWFPDLTAPDPTHALPYMLSAAMLYVVLPPKLDQLKRLLDPTATDVTWRTRLHRVLILVSLCLGPVTMHLPAALHLYWITSTLTANTLRRVVNWILKLPPQEVQRPQGRDVLIVLPPPPGPAPPATPANTPRVRQS